MKLNKIISGLLLLPLTQGVMALWSPLSVAETVAAKDVTADEDETVEFDSQFLYNTLDSDKIDTRRFSKGNPIIPGIYSVGIFVNGTLKLNTKVTFIDNGSATASACLTPKLLEQLDILLENADAPDTSPQDAGQNAASCEDLSNKLSGSRVRFDTAEQRLDITVPQIYLAKHPAGYVNPALWEEGITAFMLSYDFNAYRSAADGDSRDSAYGGLNYGANFAGWRFRARGSTNWDQENGVTYSSQDAYVQHDITALKAQFVLGDTYTQGDTFDSISLRGFRIFSDSRMQPGSASNYAPVIRGTANSNAKVTVRQSGSVIYEVTVPPGPFVIDDINPTGYGNSIDVTVEESDGSKRTFSLPYSSVTQMLRPGNTRWDIGVGKLNDSSSGNSPDVAVLTGYYGISNTFTGYAGIEAMSSDYVSALAGLAMNTPAGAFAFDITHSRADIDSDKSMEGQSYRISYNKLLTETNTSLNVAAYRFSTQDYLSLQDAASLQDEMNDDSLNKEETFKNYDRMKNQIQININQPLEYAEQDYGSLYLTGSWESYWNQSKKTSQFSLGYNNAWRWINYSISLQRDYNENGDQDNRLYISLSIPLENLFALGKRPGGFTNLNTGLSTDFKGTSQLDMSAGGYSEDNRYNYSVNTSSSLADSQSLNQIGGYGSYNSAYGPMSLSASLTDDGGRQASFGSSGGMVVHAGGITFAPGNINDTDTLALVKAKGAKGTKMSVGEGRIDSNGYAVTPYLSPYRENNVGLDISTLETDVNIVNTSTITYPRSGSVVLVNFETDEGRSVIMELQRSDNGFIPLGADVFNDKNILVGNMGQGGRAFIRGIDDKGTLHVVWGSESDQSCKINYSISENPEKVNLTVMLKNIACKMTD
ncbi:outer membrane usher protein [Rahnella victoriana]|uniref:outer membrane usher protein n=1 Tax=Rahnella victoriana TaxID=1510570 RepID=UPI001E39A343|nr:outer membrane usher protein [Rahnella victoriana]UHM92795.1 outer membrane usher protein [Rahnella victoriana]